MTVSELFSKSAPVIWPSFFMEWLGSLLQTSLQFFRNVSHTVCRPFSSRNWSKSGRFMSLLYCDVVWGWGVGGLYLPCQVNCRACHVWSRAGIPDQKAGLNLDRFFLVRIFGQKRRLLKSWFYILRDRCYFPKGRWWTLNVSFDAVDSFLLLGRAAMLTRLVWKPDAQTDMFRLTEPSAWHSCSSLWL